MNNKKKSNEKTIGIIYIIVAIIFYICGIISFCSDNTVMGGTNIAIGTMWLCISGIYFKK